MDRPQSASWHPEQIKAAVRMRGVTLTALAVSRGLPPSACREALVRPRPAGERAIAAFLGVPLHELWPGRWHADGRRRYPRASYPAGHAPQCSKRAAA
ncbi:MAG: hypothetical protein OHK0024_21220 [Thalassobaculales bacterium]